MEDMAEDATQPATQLVMDPRRLGQRGASDLTDEDLANICCILHPITIPARLAAVDVYNTTPQHAILPRYHLPTDEHGEHGQGQALQLDADGILPCDIALRLSSPLKDAPSGFIFGRNKARCDIVMGYDQLSKRISNVHFRIYVNEYGIIMLEDQSTNGTAVDGVLLRGKDKENGMDYRHTLENGAVITLTMTPPEIDYRFTVQIPRRDEEQDEAYQQNLTAHFFRMAAVSDANNGGNRGPQHAGRTEPVNLFPNGDQKTQRNSATVLGTRSIREWKGGAKYNKVGCIGKGAFAVVYKITTKFDGVPYAAKELEKRRFMKNGILDQKVDTEMNIMRQIQHANVVRFIEHVDWEDKLYIIMEFVPGGDLGSLVGKHGYLPEPHVHTMAGQLLSALKYLHKKGITHRDVKPDNILIASTNPFHVKLTDFGLSKMIDSEETFLRTFCGTLLYCAPEVYQEYREYDRFGQRHRRDKRSLPPQRYGHAVDIWSLAGVLFFSLCGSPPYRAKNGVSYQELLNQIMTIPLDIRPLQQVNVSDRAIRFVRKMLHTRPESRATIEELEQESWMTGIDEVSTQESEGASIVDDFIEPYLEQASSQLSLHDANEQPLHAGDSEVLGTQNQLRDDREIPSSFSTEGLSDQDDDSFEYVPATAPVGQGYTGRLFGEVNPSDLGGGSKLVPDALASPGSRRFVPVEVKDVEDLDEDVVDDNKENDQHVMQNAAAGLMPPPQPRVMAIRNQAYHPARPSSLQFAESMVDQLNMNSPGPESADQLPTPDVTQAATTPLTAESLRRSRFEYEAEEQSKDWHPPDLPPKRRRQSAREFPIQLPASVFWDPRDRSTHHDDYPRMSNYEFAAFEDYAAMKGENFVPGGKTFDETMRSFRASQSRSPSVELEGAVRAQSEPTKTEGRRMMMKRDERQLSEDDRVSAEPSVNAEDSSTSLQEMHEAEKDAQTRSEPLVGNDFQEPKKILGRFLAIPESCLPTLGFNITDPVTTWGKSPANSLRSINDKRLPDYGFKLVLFKPGFYDSTKSYDAVKWTEKEQDMTFYISSKADLTIYVNNFQLMHHDPHHFDTESKYWCELRHNDVVTVWWNRWVKDEVTRFTFECFWGKSRTPRVDFERNETLEDGPFLKELEEVCLREESKMLEHRIRRGKLEKDQKLNEDRHRLLRIDVGKGDNEHTEDRRRKPVDTFSASAPTPGATQGGPLNYHQSSSFKNHDA